VSGLARCAPGAPALLGRMAHLVGAAVQHGKLERQQTHKREPQEQDVPRVPPGLAARRQRLQQVQQRFQIRAGMAQKPHCAWRPHRQAPFLSQPRALADVARCRENLVPMVLGPRTLVMWVSR